MSKIFKFLSSYLKFLLSSDSFQDTRKSTIFTPKRQKLDKPRTTASKEPWKQTTLSKPI